MAMHFIGERKRVIVAIGLLITVAGVGALFLQRHRPETISTAAGPSPAAPTRARHAEPAFAQDDRTADPAPEVGETRRLSAAPGERFLFQVDAQWRAHVAPVEEAERAQPIEWHLTPDATTVMAADLQGQFEVVVVAEEEDAYVVRLALRDAQYVVDSQKGGVTRADAATLAHVGYAKIASDGRILGYTFGDDVPGDTQQLLATVLASTHQFVLRDGPEPWIVSDLEDDAGRFSAEYVWSAPRRLKNLTTLPTLHRTILGYEGRAPRKVRESASEALVEDGWIAAADVREVRTGGVGGMLNVRTQARLRLRLAARNTIAVDAASMPAAPVWRATVSDPRPAAPRRDRTPAPLRQPDAPLHAILETLAQLAAADNLDGLEGFAVWSDIADWVRSAPNTVLPEIIDQVRRGQLTGAEINWRVSALGKAGAEGCPEAANALAKLIIDESLADEIRLSAILSARQLGPHVTADVIAAATSVVGSAMDGLSDHPLGTAAALLLGNQAGQTDLPPEQLASIRETLVSFGAAAFEQGVPEVYFDALLNSGHPDWLETAFDYLGDGDERVRRAANDVLRGLHDDPRAAAALQQTIGSDASPLVRAAAADSLGEIRPTGRVIDALLTTALRDDAEFVRSNAVSALGTQFVNGSRGARTALERLSTEGDPDTQSHARSLLDGMEAEETAAVDAPESERGRRGASARS